MDVFPRSISRKKMSSRVSDALAQHPDSPTGLSFHSSRLGSKLSIPMIVNAFAWYLVKQGGQDRVLLEPCVEAQRRKPRFGVDFVGSL